MKKLILLFCISIPFLCGNVKAQTYSAAPLVSIICDTEDGDLANPKNEIGKSLLGDGFSLIGECKEPGLLGYEKMVLVKKVYKKGDYTIESQHYINGEEKEIGPIYLKIDFLSSDLCNQFFQDIVKRVKEDEEYWNEVPGGFNRGTYTYKKDEVSHIAFGMGDSEEYWLRDGNVYVYMFRIMPEQDW